MNASGPRYRTDSRGHRIQLASPADSQGDGFTAPWLGIASAMAGSGFPIERLCYTRWGEHDARHLSSLEPIKVDDPDDEENPDV